MSVHYFELRMLAIECVTSPNSKVSHGATLVFVAPDWLYCSLLSL